MHDGSFGNFMCNEIFIWLIGVVVGGSKGVVSSVYHLFTVWFLISYHYNDTLDHPECRSSELLWIIRSI